MLWFLCSDGSSSAVIDNCSLSEKASAVAVKCLTCGLNDVYYKLLVNQKDNKELGGEL